MALSPGQLALNAYLARRPYTPQTAAGMCDVLCEALSDRLTDTGVNPDHLTVTAVRCGHTQTSPHYILTIEADALTTAHDLWVDLSYDQFSTENFEDDLSPIDLGPEHDLEPIRILNPDDPRRTDYELETDWAARTQWGLTEHAPNPPTNTR